MRFDGKKLRRLRVEKGWSQAALAQKAKASRQTVNRAECGQQEPSRTTAQAFADALGVPLESFYPSGLEDGPVVLDAKEQQVIETMRGDTTGAKVVWSFAVGYRDGGSIRAAVAAVKVFAAAQGEDVDSRS